MQQGLCAALDVLESAASIGENPVMNGIHYSSIEYLRHWGECAYIDADASLTATDVQTEVHSTVLLAPTVFSVLPWVRWC
jgi:hypothetical protein